MHYELLTSTPDLLALHAADRARFPFLMQSSGDIGWDILMALP